jgi:ribose transport system permease protein
MTTMKGTPNADSPEPIQAGSGARRSPASMLGVSRLSGVYLLVLLIIAFSIWLPSLFPTSETARSIGNAQAVTGILTIGLLFPLACGAFDLSIGYSLGASSMISAALLNHGSPLVVAIVVPLLACLAIGVLNGVLVAVVGIDSFIATLGTSSILQAIILGVSGNQLIVGLPSSFTRLGTAHVLSVPIAVVYVLAIALVAWYALEHTKFGRYMYAVGHGAEAARLTGVRTRSLTFTSLLVSAFLAGIAGLLVTAEVGGASPDVGPPYLLPVFAAAFLGATQIKPGRFNVWGTIVAILLLGTGTTGLQLAGAPFWVPYLFNGVALILAVGLAVLEGRFSLYNARKRRRATAAQSTEP